MAKRKRCRDCGCLATRTEAGQGWSRTHGPKGCVLTRVLDRGMVEIGGTVYQADDFGALWPVFRDVQWLACGDPPIVAMEEARRELGERYPCAKISLLTSRRLTWEPVPVAIWLFSARVQYHKQVELVVP